MTKETPRQASVSVSYIKKVKSKKTGKQKKHTASVIAEYNEGFTYTDPASGESDTVSITLTNIDLRWANKWMPRKGDKLTAKIIQKSWEKAGKKKVFIVGSFVLTI